MTERSASRIIARNTAFGAAAQIALRGANVIFNILVVRQLGGENFGQYSVVLAWSAIFAVLGDLGITTYMTREVARDHAKANTLFWDVAVLRFLLAIVTAIITVSGAIIKPYDQEIIIGIALFTTSYFLMAIIAPLGSIVAGNERVDIISMLTIMGQMIFLALGTIFVLSGFGFLSLIVASLITMVIGLVPLVLVIRRFKYSPPPFQIHAATWWPLIRAGLPFAFIQLSLTYAFDFDTLILESNFSAETVGFYRAAYNFTRSLLIFTTAFSGAVGLTLTRENTTNPDAVRPWYYRSVKFLVFIGLPLAVGGSLLAREIMVTLYGTAYAPSAVAFAILIWDTPLLMYTSLCGQIIASILLEGRAARIYACAAALNIGLNLFLIPRYGLIAASFVTLATELTSASLFYLLFRHAIGPGLGFGRLARLAACAAAMGVVVWVLRPYAQGALTTAAIIGAAGVVYIVLVWVSGALTGEERDLLTGLARKVTGKFTRVLARG